MLRRWPSKLPPIPEQSKLTGIYRLNWFETINLNLYYPISRYFVLKKLAPLLLLYLVLAGWICAEQLDTFRYRSNQHVQELLWAILFVLTVVVGGYGTALEVSRRSIDIKIEGLRLSYTRGLFNKTTGSIVLRAYNIVYVHQTLLDYLFGLYQVQVYGSNQPSTEYAHFPALSQEDAFDLFRFFTIEFGKQISIKR